VTQISILGGIYTDNAGDFKSSYPINLEPVVAESGIAKGYLRTAPGIADFGPSPGPGTDRGGISWGSQHVRVMLNNLVTVDTSGNVTIRGNVTAGDAVTFAFSLDRLAIAAGGKLHYFKDNLVTTVIDPDIGDVLDVVWVDGYFMTTDGVYLVVTELTDPYVIDPLKYGSAEEDPDEITGLMKLRGEVYALGRYSIENFQNLGTAGFPFQRNPNALIEKGCIGARAKTYYADTFAFIGSGKNEALSVYLAGQGEALSVSTPQIDRELALVDPAEYHLVECEARVDLNESRLIIHLPTGFSAQYHFKASQAAGTPVWTILAGGPGADEAYPIRHLVYFNSQWIGGATTGYLGRLDYETGTQFNQPIGWRFDTQFVYNASRGGLVRSVELVGLTGRTPLGVEPTAFFSWTLDGEVWSQERPVSTGNFGQTQKRMQWRPGVKFANFMGLRFRGANNAVASFARLEATVEALNV